jgi:DNA sulfur modification protein DndD
MILERLTLHNFGVYRGRHVVELTPPSRQRPVVLVGGLNGGGKTTFLDALQLGLYGRVASCSNSAKLPYEEYLRRTISRGVDPHDGASVEVQLSHVVEGRMEDLCVRRSWSLRDKHTREDVEVRRNGALDTVLTEAWAEHIEGLMPVRLSRFFFFDGENIESLADLERSAEVLHRAVHVLLGLDIVDDLVKDLEHLERRKRTEQKGGEERSAIDAAWRELDLLEARRGELDLGRGEAQMTVDLAQRALRDAEQRFKLGGGDAYAQRSANEARHAAIEGELRRAEEGLCEEAEGTAPLLLVAGLLDEIATGDEVERASADAHGLAALLATRDAHALAAAERAGATRKVLAALGDLFAEDRRRYDAPGGAPAYLELSTEARAVLSTVRAAASAELPERLRRLVEGVDRLVAELDAAERKLASVPEEDAIAALAERRDAAKQDHARAEGALRVVEAELDQITREYDHKLEAYARRLKKDVDEHGATDAVARILTHSESARKALAVFRPGVLDAHVHRIEALVLEGFQYLLRKEALVSELRIDPATFTMTLYGADRRELSPERLSAGERQLLAVSIIWALARASGRPLPVVIDTPLGRLDSIHREHLVERYFPHASHQVILLSTDEEIDEGHLARLRPHIGRSYLLRHDDASGATAVEPGYFF